MRTRYLSHKKTYCKDNGTRKVRHKTLADAKAFRRLTHEEKSVDYSRIYKCPVCKGYHLTSKKWTWSTEPPTVWRDPQVRRPRNGVPYSVIAKNIIEATVLNESVDVQPAN